MSSLKKTAKQIIHQTAQYGLQLQAPDGSMPAGHNGNRHQPETAVRNTANWAIIFFTAYQLTGETAYLRAGKHSINYILLPKWRPHSATYFVRIGGKDRCNGLIGQSWILQSLLFSSYHYDTNTLIKAAEDLYQQIPFSQENGLWSIKEIDGRVHSTAQTFNQQLWMSVVALLLFKITKKNVYIHHAQQFLAQLISRQYVQQQTSGLFHHILLFPPDVAGYSRSLLIYTGLKLTTSFPKLFSDYQSLCLGYQPFILFAFALIAQLAPELVSNTIQNMVWHGIDFVESHPYYKQQEIKGYGYSYNPIGWEMAYVSTMFSHSETSSLEWISRQQAFSQPPISAMNSHDPHTLLARTSELCFLFAKWTT